jgi:hypothetical protein
VITSSRGWLIGRQRGLVLHRVVIAALATAGGTAGSSKRKLRPISFKHLGIGLGIAEQVARNLHQKKQLVLVAVLRKPTASTL